ncbi:MAG TPA: hypothetical protein VHV81_02140, partial [Steroidobacteraceae bacterium]|nr:hypothetical protein [Steroidobacteraceae bacterium]
MSRIRGGIRAGTLVKPVRSSARHAGAALALVCSLGLSACVTLPPNAPRAPQDPWESWNRGVYKVNDKLDRAFA